MVEKKDEIDKLINKALMELTESLDKELYIPIKAELAEKKVTHSLGLKKEMFKGKMESIFENLKKEIQGKMMDAKL